MDLSKLEAGKLEMTHRQLPFIPLLRRIFFSFESLAKMRDIELVFDNKLTDNYLINTDLKRFEKVINNLVSNAIKFSDNGSKVELIVDKEGQHFNIRVKDYGKGIHPDDLPYVFDRFYQSSRPSRYLDGGTGIGLAYANEIVKRFGGTLSVESTLKKGSKFICMLPANNFETMPASAIGPELSQELEVESPAMDAYVPITIGGQKPKVLVLEDNAEMQGYLRSLLEAYYNVEIAVDGQAALDKLEDGIYDLITSDIMMPRMDGFEFRENVMKQDDKKNIPFIMLTARAMEEDKLRGLRMGVDDYLTKPFSSEELLTRIDNLLRNKLERDDYRKEEDEEENLNAEQKILKQAEEYVLNNIDDLNLSVPLLAKELGYSQRQVARVMKKLTGLTPVNFILEMRLQKARQLLEAKTFLSVDEVRYEIGIESASYFSRKFKERFGRNASSYL